MYVHSCDTSLYLCLSFVHLAAAPNTESNMYFEIKMDSKTNEYKIGTPIKSTEYIGHRRQGSGGSLKQYSLSPPNNGKDRNFYTHFTHLFAFLMKIYTICVMSILV